MGGSAQHESAFVGKGIPKNIISPLSFVTSFFRSREWDHSRRGRCKHKRGTARSAPYSSMSFARIEPLEQTSDGTG